MRNRKKNPGVKIVTTMAIPADIQRQIEAALTAKGLVRDGQIVSILPRSGAVRTIESAADPARRTLKTES